MTLCFLVLSWLGCFVFDHKWIWDYPRITVPPKSNRILSFNQECGIQWDTPVLVNLHVYVVVFILGQGGHPVRLHLVAPDRPMGAVRAADSAGSPFTGRASLSSGCGECGAVPGIAGAAAERGGTSVATPSGGTTDCQVVAQQ